MILAYSFGGFWLCIIFFRIQVPFFYDILTCSDILDSFLDYIIFILIGRVLFLHIFKCDINIFNDGLNFLEIDSVGTYYNTPERLFIPFVIQFFFFFISIFDNIVSCPKYEKIINIGFSSSP